jgi:IS30 family transposase
MSYFHLTSEERYVISHLVLYGLSFREIGRRLNRHHTTICREIKRNRPTYADDAVYWYEAAQAYAGQRKRMSHHSIRKITPELVHYVKCKPLRLCGE